MNILIPVMVLGTLGFIFGVWLMFAHKIFAVKIDPRVEQILNILPGANCGACGSAGCQAFAAALVRGKADVSDCALGGVETHKVLAEILGVELKEETKQVATLICGGGKKCTDKYNYAGPQTCAAAEILLGGEKSCRFACIGFGDCVKACPFDAITMGEDELPVIDEDKCIACGKCIEACPKEVLVLTPVDKFYHIRCNSKDKGAQVVKICKVGCIGCGKCIKACPRGAITLENNLAKIDYDKCTNCGECVKVCPTHAIEERKQRCYNQEAMTPHYY